MTDEPMSFGAMRVQVSAIKARGYFEDAGRGLLITRPTETDPFGDWLQTVVGDEADRTMTFENRYFTLDMLKANDCPAYVLHMIETYDPTREAVVAVTLDLDDVPEPQIVRLPTSDLH